MISSRFGLYGSPLTHLTRPEVAYEKILCADVENGNRFETYAIAGKRGSHVCCLNGAAAHKGKVGDRLIVMAFASFTPEEAAGWQPRVKHFG